MPDQDARRLEFTPEEVGSRLQVGHVGGEIGVGKIAFAGAQAGEVEAQYGNAMFSQRLRNAAGCENILAAGEAMRKQGVGTYAVFWRVQPRRQHLPLGAREFESLCVHIAPSGLRPSYAFYKLVQCRVQLLAQAFHVGHGIARRCCLTMRDLVEVQLRRRVQGFVQALRRRHQPGALYW